MSQLVLDRNARLLLQAKAHHLDPVVLLGGNGLTEAVIKEVDRALTAHGLIKVKIPSDDREERTAIFEELADKLGAAKITQIGKLLVLFRPIPEKEETEETLIQDKIKAIPHNSACRCPHRRLNLQGREGSVQPKRKTCILTCLALRATCQCRQNRV